MSLLWHLSFLLAIFVVAKATMVSEPFRIAVATLTPRSLIQEQTIAGSIAFTETAEGLRIVGTITGLPPGNYGFHVHEMGDISTCDSSGAHFNPDVTNHGGRDHEVRHVGDLGNVAFVTSTANTGIAQIDILDTVLTLRGRNSVVGRSLVLHAQEDDLGLGGHADSLTTGNAGARVACGVIGIMSPVDPWNSAATGMPSLFVYVTAVLFVYLSA